MPKTTEDPMRYVATKEEWTEAYERAPACHHLTHRLQVRRYVQRQIEELERLLEESP